MKEDSSLILYKKYFASKDRMITVTLKNGAVLEGAFIGFFHGNSLRDEPFIIKWRFIPKKDLPDNSPRLWDFNEGFIINQEDIKSVKWSGGEMLFV